MAIISATTLIAELPTDAPNSNSEIQDAVDRASAFVDTWTSNKYYPWDSFTASPLTINAPSEIEHACIQVAVALYKQRIAERSRDGQEIVSNGEMLEYWRQYLQSIDVSPTWETETISLDSSTLSMGLGSRTNSIVWTQVIPQTVQVTSGSGNVWTQPDDFEVTLGGRYNNEYRDRWYLRADSSSFEGTVRYMRSYRSDGLDYARYSRAT